MKKKIRNVSFLCSTNNKAISHDNIGWKNGQDRWKMKDGRMQSSIRSCSLYGFCCRNLHKQTSSFTAFRIFATTGKRKREREKKNWHYLSLFLFLKLPLNAVTENFNRARDVSVASLTHPRFLRFLVYFSSFPRRYLWKNSFDHSFFLERRIFRQ